MSSVSEFANYAPLYVECVSAEFIELLTDTIKILTTRQMIQSMKDLCLEAALIVIELVDSFGNGFVGIIGRGYLSDFGHPLSDEFVQSLDILPPGEPLISPVLRILQTERQPTRGGKRQTDDTNNIVCTHLCGSLMFWQEEQLNKVIVAPRGGMSSLRCRSRRRQT